MAAANTAKPGYFPTVTGKNLTGQTFTFPADLKKDINLIAVAFQREQQADVDTWILKMEPLEKEYPQFAFFEVPTIREMNPFSRWFIYQGMRSGIPSQQARLRTVTLHIDKEPFKRALGISNENQIYLYLTDREGKILWQTQERWTEEKHQELLTFLQK